STFPCTTPTGPASARWSSSSSTRSRRTSRPPWAGGCEFREMSAGTPEDWLTETWKITVDIYANVKTDENYSYKYVYDYAPVVERQFLLAGYRLAALLNRIFG
ncbi:MAG: hypothetical protein II037_00925, partial [Bacteroidales bacterium]|nr:hypothetical protein [Bacteroidales bacterium]